jgi:hypothetical protein
VAKAAYLKQGGHTAGHRELWRLLRTLFKETRDIDELIDYAPSPKPTPRRLIDRIGEPRSGMGIMGIRLPDDSRQLEHLSSEIPHPPS